MRSLLLVALVVAGAANAGPSITTLWNARALEAMDTLSKIADDKGSDVGQPSSPRRFELLLETAFAMHLTEPEMLRKPFNNGGTGFHLMIDAGAESGVFDLVYLYDAKGRPAGVRVDRLPKGWMVLFQPHLEPQMADLMKRRRRMRGEDVAAAPRPIVIGAGEIILVFDAADPFSPFVLQSVLNAPGDAEPAARKGTKARTVRGSEP